MTTTISANILSIDKQIRLAEKQQGRKPHSVQLLAVSKSQSVEALREAIAAGQRCFGENYVQEAVPKILALADAALEWHYIGAIQTNKTKLLAEHFSWVHTVQRKEVAKRLNEQRSAHLPPLNICIEVNIGAESQKSGVSLAEINEIIEYVSALPRLKLRGLMIVPPHTTHVPEQRKYFHLLKCEFDKLCEQAYPLDTLSMGMSADWQVAIEEGATLIRLGTAIFGARNQ